ncbi:MAG: RNA polymerase sigma factor [Phycisphaeraceae bacterium]
MNHPNTPRPDDTHDPSEPLRRAVARYHRPLVAYALSKTGDLERARDAAQDALLALCQQPADRFEREIQPRLAAWLFTVCRHRLIDLHRKERRMTHADPHTLDAPASTGGPAEHAEANDQKAHLLGLVDALPGHQREVVQLRFQGGLAYKDIAEVTGHSVSYVGVILHDAIKQLRQQITTLNA